MNPNHSQHPLPRTTTRSTLLTVTALALLGLSGCDTEQDLGPDDEPLLLEADAEDRGDDLDPSMDELLTRAENAGPKADLLDSDLGLAVDTGDQPESRAYSTSYHGVTSISDLDDGDAILIKPFYHGYLGCDANGVIQSEHSLFSTDNFIWEVHLVDLNGDGTTEVQFELIDATGQTGTFLKMSQQGVLSCEPIFGSGTWASWNTGAVMQRGGTHHQQFDVQLVNFSHDLCLSAIGGYDDFAGEACHYSWDTGFTFEVIASAS